MSFEPKRRVLSRALAFLLVAGVLGGVFGEALGKKQNGPDRDNPDASVFISFREDEASGVRVYHVENPMDLGYVRYQVNGTRTYDYNPWHIQFIRPDGAVAPLFNFQGITSDADLASWGQGDGVAYAGVGPVTAQTPEVSNLRQPLWIDLGDHLPGTSGWLVFAWANQVGPISFSLELAPKTVTNLVAQGSLEAREIKDFQGGARVGAPVAAIASVGDGWSIEPAGDQLWGYVFYMKSITFGHGKLGFNRAGDGLHRELSFDATPQDSPTCVCFQWGRWVFTSDSLLDIGYSYVGDGRRTAVYVIVAHLPAGTLPRNVWQEFNLTPSYSASAFTSNGQSTLNPLEQNARMEARLDAKAS
jgi:hypothetical protein